MSGTDVNARSRAARWAGGPWLPAVLALLCFANTLRNDFVYDDNPIIVYNTRVQNLADVRGIWLSDWWRPSGEAPESEWQRDRLYRPLTMFSFAINYAVHGLEPMGFHLVNVLLHALCTFLVWHLARRLLNDARIASVAAALFAVHPVHVEAVANIVGRAELLSTAFLLLGLVPLLPRERHAAGPSSGTGLQPARPQPAITAAHVVIAACAFLLALLAKESAICYVGVVALFAFLRRAHAGTTPRRRIAYACILLVPLLVYFPLRYVALEGQFIRPPLERLLLNPLVGAAPADRALGALTVLGHYTRVLVLPARLSCDYGLAVIDPAAGFNATTLLGLFAAVGLLAGIACFLRRTLTARTVAALTGAFVVSYFLISNAVLLIGVAVAERLMYWPSVPIVLLGAYAAVGLWERTRTGAYASPDRERAIRILGVALLCVLAIRSVVRNGDWASNLMLSHRDVASFPQSAHLNKAAALSLMWSAENQPDPQRQWAMLVEAEAFLSRALAIEPAFPAALALRARVRAYFGDAHASLGRADEAAQQREAARADAEAALLLEPGNRSAVFVLNQLAGVSEQRARAALDALRERAAQAPDDVEALRALGTALLDAGHVPEAVDHLARLASLRPGDPRVLETYGAALMATGRQAEAQDVFRRVLDQDPDSWVAHINLALALRRTDPDGALHHARRAYELDPDDLRTGMNLAALYTNLGQRAAAREQYTAMLRRLPPDSLYRTMIESRLRDLDRR